MHFEEPHPFVLHRVTKGVILKIDRQLVNLAHQKRKKPAFLFIMNFQTLVLRVGLGPGELKPKNSGYTEHI